MNKWLRQGNKQKDYYKQNLIEHIKELKIHETEQLIKEEK